AQLLARLAAVRGDRGDRTDRQAVVAAEHDRHAAGVEFARGCLEHGAVPGHDFVEVAVAPGRRLPRVARALDVAAVDHVDAARGQRLRQPGHAQRLRTHAGAAGAGADVGGRADDRYGGIAAAHGGSDSGGPPPAGPWSRGSRPAPGAGRPVRPRAFARETRRRPPGAAHRPDSTEYLPRRLPRGAFTSPWSPRC